MKFVLVRIIICIILVAIINYIVDKLRLHGYKKNIILWILYFIAFTSVSLI